MEKLVYLLGSTPAGEVPPPRKDLRDALLAAGPVLGAAGARAVRIAVADLEDPEARRCVQRNPDGLIDACVSFWLPSLDDRSAAEAVLAPVAERMAGYLVTESVPRRPPPPDASGRVPGVALVTALAKKRGLDDATFYARWHGSHTPLSLEIHPLTAYVRNAVARVLTPGAPEVRGIVLEAVASAAVAADPDAFYGGDADRERAVRDLLSFTDFDTLSTAVMSEYVLPGESLTVGAFR